MAEIFIDPKIVKIVVFVFAFLSFLTGNVAYFRLQKLYKKSGEINRQFYHIIFNVLTLLSAVYLTVLAPEPGWIVLLIAIATFISGIFTYRYMQINVQKGKEKLEKPTMHAISGLILVLYTAYIWMWEAIGIGGLIFG